MGEPKAVTLIPDVAVPDVFWSLTSEPESPEEMRMDWPWVAACANRLSRKV